MRLFLGTFLESKHKELVPFNEIEKLFVADLKPVKRDNIHITWGFFGDVEAKYVLPLQETINKHISMFKGIIFLAQSIEYWPFKRSPRLIVLRGELNKELLFSELHNDLKQFCSPDIKKDFIPHITIARFKKDVTPNRNIKLPQLTRFNWEIKSISLVESFLDNKGPSYKQIKEWQLLL